jgi:hypothetical protein
MKALRIFIILSGIFRQSGKLRIFLYPSLSTGKPCIRILIGISGGLKRFCEDVFSYGLKGWRSGNTPTSSQTGPDCFI